MWHTVYCWATPCILEVLIRLTSQIQCTSHKTLNGVVLVFTIPVFIANSFFNISFAVHWCSVKWCVLQIFWFKVRHLWCNLGKWVAWLADCWLCTAWQWAAMLEQPNSVSLWSTSATGNPGSRGQLYTFCLNKQSLPLTTFTKKRGKISSSCDSQEEILGTGKGLREEVIKTAPSSGNKKCFVISHERLDCCF